MTGMNEWLKTTNGDRIRGKAATPVRTRCATRPATAPSAGCVSGAGGGGGHRQGPRGHGRHLQAGQTRSRRDWRPGCAGSCPDAISDSASEGVCGTDSEQFSSVQPLSRVRLFATPMDRSTPGLRHQLLELIQTYVHRVGDGIQPSHPLSFFPPSIFPSIRVFSNASDKT